MPLKRVVLLRFVTDFVVIIAVGLPVLILYLKGVPSHRGFFCDDDSIRYPYRNSTITNTALYLMGIFVPLVSIAFNEIYMLLRNKRAKQRHDGVYALFGYSVPEVLNLLYKQIRFFLFGACVSQLLTDIAKYRIGRLRPHFIDVCDPSVSCMTQKDKHLYVEEYSCRSDDVEKVREARLSFPSGHSSFSAYSMMYLILYLQARMDVQSHKLLRPFLQLILFVMTWYTALSRISDYKHHWSDVLVGFLLGSLVAVIIAVFVARFFTKNSEGQGSEKMFRNATGMTDAHDVIDLEQQ